MAVTEDPQPGVNGETIAVAVACEKRDAVVVACKEEETLLEPKAETTEIETDTETDQHGIDFVTLGMIIIGRPPSYVSSILRFFYLVPCYDVCLQCIFASSESDSDESGPHHDTLPI
jgi:hypothetical protein